jgi:tetratricopeptide (TPR) repeat protein
MSYINDALKKAREEKDSRYGIYRDVILPVDPGKTGARRKRPVAAALMGFVFLSAGSFYLYQSAGKTALRPPPAVVEARPDIIPAAVVEQSLTPAAAETPKRGVPALDHAARAEKFYQGGLAQQREGRIAAAETFYEKALALDPKHVHALNNLGVVYMSRNHNKQAIALLKQAMALKKDYADPYYNLACLYAKGNNVHEAMRYLKQAVSINGEVAQWARSDKDLMNLRVLPAFVSLIEKRGD